MSDENVEVEPNRIRYLCKAPGCGKDLTFSSMRVHMAKEPEHSKYGYKAVLTRDLIKEVSVPQEESLEDEGPVVTEVRTDHATSDEPTPQRPVPSATRAPRTAVSPLPLSPTAPEPTFFSAKLKLPVSLYEYYDIAKSHYSGDFSDFIAEAAIDGIIAALKQYCEECGGKIDKCPHCQADLPSVELAMVVRK